MLLIKLITVSNLHYPEEEATEDELTEANYTDENYEEINSGNRREDP